MDKEHKVSLALAFILSCLAGVPFVLAGWNFLLMAITQLVVFSLVIGWLDNRRE